jgi:microcin C transport system substrate-binding protein
MRIAALVLAAVLASTAAFADGAAKHGFATFGDLKYPADFTHFAYVNPDAPKGGTVKFAAQGTFDSLNPYILKGTSAVGIGETVDTLLTPALDEPSSAYGLVAASVEVAPDRTWAQFNLRPEARFHDGSPMTPADVVWTFETLLDKGAPQYKLYYADVLKAEVAGPHAVRFTFRSGENRELPLILGELPVLSKTYWTAHDFAKTTLQPPLGSGPYKIESLEPGRSITYRRVPDYWAKDLPVERGRNNFDVIRYDYYRDRSVMLEAFKAGQYDFQAVATAKDWAVGYDGPALEKGLIKKEVLPIHRPTGMQGFGYNLRNPKFQNRRLREALDYLFDFEWTNKHLFYGLYKRDTSYFTNSPLASSGLPGPEELKILEKYRGEIPDEVFTNVYEPPHTDGSGNIRENLGHAIRLLKEAGYTFKNETLVNDATGQPFEFEFLSDEPAFERIVQPFVQNLARAGIRCTIRMVDPAQYQRRMDTFDFEMTVVLVPESLSPGNEQRDFWGAAAADREGSRNYMGIRNKAIDDLVELIANPPDRPTLVARVHALDRILLQSHFAILNFYSPDMRVALWDKFGHPDKLPPEMWSLDIASWWIDPKKEAALAAGKAADAK